MIDLIPIERLNSLYDHVETMARDYNSDEAKSEIAKLSIRMEQRRVNHCDWTDAFPLIKQPLPNGTDNIKKKIAGIRKRTCSPRLISSGYLERYFEHLSYNHLQETFFDVKKSYSIRRVCKLSQQMIDAGLPIKCLEAVALGIYMTINLTTIDRIRKNCSMPLI